MRKTMLLEFETHINESVLLILFKTTCVVMLSEQSIASSNSFGI